MTPEKQLSSNPLTLSDALKNFGVGAFFGGLIMFVYLLTSVFMTHSTLADVGTLQLTLSVAIPLICGGLAVVWKKPFIDFITGISSSLPF